MNVHDGLAREHDVVHYVLLDFLRILIIMVRGRGRGSARTW